MENRRNPEESKERAEEPIKVCNFDVATPCDIV